MKPKSVLLLLCIPLLLAAPSVWANEKLAGAWTLNLEKSEGMRQKPKSLLQTVKVEDGNVTIHRQFEPPEGEPRTIEFTYVTDGEQHSVPVADGSSREVKARWKGKKLFVEFELRPQRNILVPVTERWSLKGKDRLLVKTTARTPVGDRVVKMYFDRTSGGDR